MMETIALRALEEHTRQLIATLATGDQKLIAIRLMVVAKDLDTIAAIREIDAATDVGDEDNPLIRKHDD